MRDLLEWVSLHYLMSKVLIVLKYLVFLPKVQCTVPAGFPLRFSSWRNRFPKWAFLCHFRPNFASENYQMPFLHFYRIPNAFCNSEILNFCEVQGTVLLNSNLICEFESLILRVKFLQCYSSTISLLLVYIVPSRNRKENEKREGPDPRPVRNAEEIMANLCTWFYNSVMGLSLETFCSKIKILPN